MAKQIWVRKGEVVRGPFSAAQVRQLAESGKLTPLHEVSTDQKRWKPAGEVPGLGLADPPAVGISAGPAIDWSEGLPEAAPNGAKFALGVILLVLVALLVTGTCLLQLGLVDGLTFSLIFLLTAALGYPAACLGREVSAIYVVIVAAVCVMLMGESQVGYAGAFVSFGGFAASLVPGLVLIVGWTLVTHGLGHTYEPADLARLNPARFSTSPITETELKRAIAATKDEAAEAPAKVKLRLDPDDLDDLDESFGEVLEEEARRSVPGILVSLAVHAVIFLALWFWRVQVFSEEEYTLDLAWKTISADEQTAVIPPEQRNIDLQAMQLTPQNPPPTGEEKPLKALNVGPGSPQVVPVQPVEVGRLFEGRSEDKRERILKETGSGQRIEQAISQGLAWLSRQQQPAGNWRLHTGYPDASEWPDIKTDTGATALALLAFLGNGQTHKSAKDKATQEVVQKGLDWLIGIQNENGNGDFHDLSAERGRNPAFYAHAQATIVMCEAYALTKDRTLYGPAQKGVDYLLKSQQPNEGGWKYHPLDAQSIGDLSVTGWVLMALHSARAAEIPVPEEQFQRASKFLNLVQDKGGARYRYQPTGWDVSRAMTAEGLLCRQFLGWPKNQPQLLEGIEYLLDEKYKPTWQEGRRNVYEWYYVGHVLHNMDDEEWTDWYDHTQKEIIANQITSGSGDYRGSWNPNKPVGAPYEFADKAGRLYITAMCLLILEMPVRHHPIYGD